MKKILYISLIISIGIFLFSCQKKTKTGYGVLPKSDLTDLNITDTFAIQVHTFKADSTLSGQAKEFLLGEYQDEIFGQTKAGFVSQFSMVAPYINFKDTDIVDSVILTIPYNQNDNNIYGQASQAQHIKIYRINVDLDKSINYYTNEDTAAYKGELIGEVHDFVPYPSDSLLTIQLDNALGESFFAADPSNFSSSQAFHNFFKGVFFEAYSDDGNASIVKFDNSNKFLLSIHFHKNDGSDKKYKYQLTTNNLENARFNIINHNYDNANFAGPFNDSSLPQDTVAYLQAGGGLYARIEMPGLENFTKSNSVIINKAELVIPSASESVSLENAYPAIKDTYISGYISGDSSLLIPDYITQTSYGHESYKDKMYRFNITSYVQDIIDGNSENKGINLRPKYSGNNISRTVITTGNNSKPVKLFITYTKIN